MKTLNILIVEDEALVAWDLKNQLTKAGYNVIGPYNNAAEALRAFEQETVDLALLDIHIKGVQDGIYIAQTIRLKSDIPLVFLTAMSSKVFVERAKQVQPSAYLLKPYQAPSLHIAIEMAFSNFENQQMAAAPASIMHKPALETKISSQKLKEVFLVQQNFAIIKPQKVFVKININDILYVEAEHVYTKIYTLTQNFLLRTTLQTISEKLALFPFLRTHRSFLVNMALIERFDEENVYILQKSVPISKTYKADFLAYFSK